MSGAAAVAPFKLLGAADGAVVLVPPLSACGSWGVLLWLPTTIIKYICDKDACSDSLSPSHTHTFTTRRLLIHVSVYFQMFVFQVLYVCSFLQVQQLAVHCGFLFVLYPFIIFPPISLTYIFISILANLSLRTPPL